MRQNIFPPWQKLLQLSWHCVSPLAALCFSRRCVRTPSPPGSPCGSGRTRGNAEASEAAGTQSRDNMIVRCVLVQWLKMWYFQERERVKYATLPLPCQSQPNVGPWTWQSAQRRTRRTETEKDQSCSNNLLYWLTQLFQNSINHLNSKYEGGGKPSGHSWLLHAHCSSSQRSSP